MCNFQRMIKKKSCRISRGVTQFCGISSALPRISRGKVKISERVCKKVCPQPTTLPLRPQIPTPPAPPPPPPPPQFFYLFGLVLMFPCLRDNKKKVENNWESNNHLKLWLLNI